MIAAFGRYRFSNFVLTRVEMRNEKPKRPREPFRLLRGRFESNENQYDEFLSFTLHNRFKNYGVDSNCHQSTDAVAVNLPTQVQGRSPGKSQRLRTCGYIYDGGTSSRLLRDFSSHSTFHGKPSPGFVRRRTTLAENFQARLVQCSIVLLFHSHVVLLFRFAVIALSHSYATT